MPSKLDPHVATVEDWFAAGLSSYLGAVSRIDNGGDRVSCSPATGLNLNRTRALVGKGRDAHSPFAQRC
jgi:hypothetical protein